MKCEKFKDCQNAIYTHKCKSCGSGMLNFVDKNNRQNQCANFELDDWGVCKYQYDWEIDTCENNCLKNINK